MGAGSLTAAVVLVVVASGCASPTVPPPPAATPTPSPTPALFPMGAANATLLENIALVRQLERFQRDNTILVSMSGFAVGLDGRIAVGSSWQYNFAEPAPLRLIRHWAVDRQGAIRTLPTTPPPSSGLDFTELGPYVGVDSPEAISLAFEYGARPILDFYPNAIARMSLRFQGRVATWEIRFADSPPRPVCELGPIYISATDGSLLAKDLSCLDRQ